MKRKGNSSMVIKNITADKILASLGDYTVEATITFADESISSASVPAGISAGKYEVKKVTPDEAIREIGEMGEICKDKDWNQENLDKEISSHNFGGNSTLAVSAAFFKKNFKFQISNFKLPKLMLLLFEGGEHGNPNLTIQEFMIIEDSVQQASEDFARLKDYLKQNNIESTVGAEGGFSPLAFNNSQAIDAIRNIFPDKKIALDMASSFHQSPIPEGIFSVEDPFSEDDWDEFRILNLESGILVIGDDLTVTNIERIQKAIDLKAVGGVVIKPNQIGTITGALEAVYLARKVGLKIIISHRGQETNDTWIADFSVFAGSDYVKFGGLDRGERIAKYNRLLQIQSGIQI